MLKAHFHDVKNNISCIYDYECATLTHISTDIYSLAKGAYGALSSRMPDCKVNTFSHGTHYLLASA